MNLPVIFAPEAQEDLDELQQYLANRFSERNAKRYFQRVVAACQSVGFAPYRGTRHDKIRPGLRSTGFEGRITILFEVTSNEVNILQVLYGGRQRQ